MINEALTFLCNELNRHFRASLSVNEDRAIVSAPAGEQQADKVIITLFNVEEDNLQKNLNVHPARVGDGSLKTMKPPLSLNLSILLSASFNDYPESLKYISAALSFFHENSVFNRENAPALNSNIDKLVVEQINLSHEDNAHLWSMLGCRYSPSLVYRVRVLGGKLL